MGTSRYRYANGGSENFHPPPRKANTMEAITPSSITTIEKGQSKKVILISMSLVLLLFVMTACGGGGSKKSGSDSSSDTQKIDVSLKSTGSDMSIEPATVTVKAGTHVVLNVTNDGDVIHNLSMADGMKTADLAQYSTAEFDIGTINEDTELHCAIAGHKEQGMVMNIKVEK